MPSRAGIDVCGPIYLYTDGGAAPRTRRVHAGPGPRDGELPSGTPSFAYGNPSAQPDGQYPTHTRAPRPNPGRRPRNTASCASWILARPRDGFCGLATAAFAPRWLRNGHGITDAQECENEWYLRAGARQARGGLGSLLSCLVAPLVGQGDGGPKASMQQRVGVSRLFYFYAITHVAAYSSSKLRFSRLGFQSSSSSKTGVRTNLL